MLWVYEVLVVLFNETGAFLIKMGRVRLKIEAGKKKYFSELWNLTEKTVTAGQRGCFFSGLFSCQLLKVTFHFFISQVSIVFVSWK